MNIPVTLNVKSANAIPVISCMQGDTPTIVCTVMNDTEKFIVDKAEFDLCVCEGETAKHKAVTINASTNGNTVSVKMTKNETDEAGDIKLCIRFSNTKNNTVISTFPFILKATQNPSYSAVGQMDDVSALTDYVAEAKKYADNAKETTADVSTLAQKTTEKAQEAESSATAAKESANIADNRATEAQEAAAATSKSSSTATSAAEYAASCQKEIEQLASEVENNSNIAKSYAVGETSARDNEDIDNAKYYSEQAKNYADKAQQATKQIEVDSELSETSTNPVENKVINAEIDNLQLQINDIGQNDTLAHNSIHTSIDKVSQEENITRGILTQWQEQGRIPNGIVNNLVTTEEGYVADARQLNKSVENSFAYEMDKSISAINNSLSKNLNRNYQVILPATKIGKSQYHRANFPNINVDGTMLYCRIIDDNHCQYNLMDMGDFLILPLFRDTSKYGWRILVDSDGSYVSIYYDATNKQIIVYSSYDDAEVGLWAFNWKF